MNLRSSIYLVSGTRSTLNMPTLHEKIRSVFNEAQRGVQLHTRLVSDLQNAFKESKTFGDVKPDPDEEGFTKVFVDHLRHVMLVYKREPAVERTVDFVARFLTSLPNEEPKIKKETEDQEDQDLSDEEEESMNPLLIFIFNFLLDSHNAKDRAVRFRSCQLINKLLTYMDEHVSIDEDLFDRIYDCMLIRLRDKFPTIRTQAVLALYRLQEPTDEECPVISSFLHLMENDNNPEVRRAVLCNIAVRTTTLQPIIGRTRDVKESVRKTAFKVLAEKVNIKALSIAQRLQLLNDGMYDRSQAVKDECSNNLFKSWLKTVDNKVVKLLECLHVESSPETAEMTLKSLFEGASRDDLKAHIEALKSISTENSSTVDIPYDTIGPEIAIYWRSLVQHVTSMKADGQDLLELLLPEASKFCDYVQGFAQKCPIESDSMSVTILDETVSKVEFVMRQLLELVGLLDLSDEIGRVSINFAALLELYERTLTMTQDFISTKRIITLVHDLLLSESIPPSLVDLLVARYADAQTSEDTLVQSLVEIISDIKEPMVILPTPQLEKQKRERQLQIAKVKVEINELKEELDSSVKDEDFSKAAEIKNKLKTLEEQKETLETEDISVHQTSKVEKDDPVTITKCLAIASEMLGKVNRKGLTPTLTTLVHTLIWPALQNEEPLIRNAAVKCLGLCSLLCKDFAYQHIVLFLQVAQIDQEAVRVTATQVVFDLLQAYGIETFAAVKEEKEEKGENDDNSKDAADNDEPIAEATEEDEEKDSNQEDNSDDDTENAGKSILNILMILLDSECQEIRTLAAEGMAKLMLSGRLVSTKLLSRLVLLWYNPTVEEDLQFRHCLGVFLPVFAFASRANQELFADAFIPILRTLFNAPDTSPLSTVNPNNVTELLVQLCNPRHLRAHTTTNNVRSENLQDLKIHESLALKISNEILSDPSDVNNKVLVRVLTMLEISPTNQDNVKDLQVLCGRMIEEVKDRTALKLLAKFKKTLDYLAEVAEKEQSSTQ